MTCGASGGCDCSLCGIEAGAGAASAAVAVGDGVGVAAGGSGTYRLNRREKMLLGMGLLPPGQLAHQAADGLSAPTHPRFTLLRSTCFLWYWFVLVQPLELTGGWWNLVMVSSVAY